MSQLISESIKLIVFELGQEEFAIEITKINSILRMQPITQIPYAVKFVEGIINFRGRPLVVIDLRKRFNLPKKDDLDKMRIVVLDFHPFLIGMIVDNVTEVLSLPYSVIEPVPDNLASLDIEQEYLLGVGNLDKGERLVILLDLGKIFSDNELEELGVVFSNDARIKMYLDESKEEADQMREKIRVSASEARLNTVSTVDTDRSTSHQADDAFLDQERAMIRQMAIRDLQKEMGISVETQEDTIFLKEDEAFEEEEGVEYIYVDEDGNEIPADELKLDHSLESDLVSPSAPPPVTADEIDDVSSLISAAIGDNASSATDPVVKTVDDDVLSEDAGKRIGNEDVAALIAAVQAKRDAAGPSTTPTSEMIEKYQAYLNSITKSKIVDLSHSHSGLKLEKKMKKQTMISKFLGYLQAESPETLIKYFNE